MEVPVCLNLALCYIKCDKAHHAIKYASQMLNRNFKPAQLTNGEATLQKAHFRRGQAYMMIGDLNKARVDLREAYEYGQTLGKPDKAVNDALKEVQGKLDLNKEREKEMSKRMFSFGSDSTKPSSS